MGAIREDQKENASKFMSALWNEFVKPYYNSEDTDEFWLGMMGKMNDLYNTYHLDENPQLCEMMMGFSCGLEIFAGNERRIRGVETLLRKMKGIG